MKTEGPNLFAEALLSSISDFIYTFDLNGRISYANQPFLDLLELSLEEIKGKTLGELKLPCEFIHKHEINIKKVINTGRPSSGIQFFTSRFGLRCYEYLFAPIRDDEGMINGVIATPRDITHSYLKTEEYTEFEKTIRELTKLKEVIKGMRFQEVKAQVINIESLVNLIEEDLCEENKQKIALTLDMLRQSIYKLKTSSSDMASEIDIDI